MYKFWYDYVKPKHEEKSKLCYMDTGSFIGYIKTCNNYKEIAEDVETRFDISNQELESPLSKGTNKRVVWLMTDELRGKILNLFVGLRVKTYGQIHYIFLISNSFISDCTRFYKTINQLQCWQIFGNSTVKPLIAFVSMNKKIIVCTDL